MRTVYFKHRKLFDFESKFDIGHATFWKRNVEDNHFLYRLEELSQEEWSAFYFYHLQYFLNQYSNSTESEFYNHVCKILDNAISGLKGKDRFDSNHAVFFRRQLLYEAFLSYVTSTNPDGIEKAKDEVIASQKVEILRLQKIITDLENQVRESRKNQTTDYLNIAPAHLMTLVDLIYQFQELKIEDRELIFSQTQIIWPKILSEYFKVDNKDIKFETIRRYFPADRSRAVPVKNRLFKISPTKDSGKDKQSRTSTRTSIK